MLIHPITRQSRLPVWWQPLLQPRHLPLPYSNGCRVAEVEAEGAGAMEVEEAAAEEAAVEAAVEVAEEAAEEAVEEEAHPVDNLLLHLQPLCQLHLTTEED